MNWDISLHGPYFLISEQRYKSYDGVCIYTEAAYVRTKKQNDCVTCGASEAWAMGETSCLTSCGDL